MIGSIKYSIILFFILLILSFYNYPNIYKYSNIKKNSFDITCGLPIIIIIISIFSYYIIVYGKYILNLS